MLESGGKITEAVIIDGVRQEMIYWERKREGLEMSVVDNIREIIMLRKYDCGEVTPYSKILWLRMKHNSANYYAAYLTKKKRKLKKNIRNHL